MADVDDTPRKRDANAPMLLLQLSDVLPNALDRDIVSLTGVRL